MNERIIDLEDERIDSYDGTRASTGKIITERALSGVLSNLLWDGVEAAGNTFQKLYALIGDSVKYTDLTASVIDGSTGKAFSASGAKYLSGHLDTLFSSYTGLSGNVHPRVDEKIFTSAIDDTLSQNSGSMVLSSSGGANLNTRLITANTLIAALSDKISYTKLSPSGIINTLTGGLGSLPAF